MPETLNKEFRFGSKSHRMLLMQVQERKKYSEDKMRSDHHDRWIHNDEDMQAYIPLSDADTKRKSNRRRAHVQPDYVTLVVPYGYAIIASMHTYISSVFLSRAPIYQFTGRHGETQNAVQAVEAVMDYNLRVGRQLPYLYNWMYDACKYGVGVIGEFWDSEVKQVARIVEKETTLLGIGTGNTKKVRTVEEVPGFQGNRLYNIRPFDFHPDPRLPLYDFQRGEFCGRSTRIGLSELLGLRDQGKYFNLDILQRTKGNKDEIDKLSHTFASGSGLDEVLEAGSSILDLPFGVQGSDDSASPGKGFVHLTEMCIKVQPKRWKLGNSDKVETWVFTLANNRVIIGARPLGLYHNRFPYSVFETGFGSEEFIKASVLDNVRPLGDALTWLFNSHMYNVRQAVNDRLIVDPSKIVMKDLEKKDPGARIRLSPEYYGGDVRTAVHQLTQTDITQANMRDAQVIEELMQRVSGVTDNIMGMVNPRGRKTATEVRTSSGFAINRQKTIAEYMSATGFGELSDRQLSNIQQLMTLEQKFMVAGNTLANAEKFIQVTPEAIAGGYDFVPVDGTLPVDRLAQANFWKELLGQLARIPEIAAQWDFGEMLSYVMSIQGEKNADRFKIQVAPPGGLPNGVVPLKEAANARGQQPRAAGSSGGTI